MDHADFIVCRLRENFIGLRRVNVIYDVYVLCFPDKNGFGPIAAYPHTCTFSRDTSQEIDKGDPDTLLNTQEVIKDG